jgi:xanthine dehydrogenase YagS FAD-binding subunit
MIIAGGADALSLLKSDLSAPSLLIDLKPARALRGISVDPDGVVRLGALTTLADIERDEALAERLPILRQAARDAATPQLRNIATVGGNLLQRTRCWYYRGPYQCWQKGGATCFARDGQNKYHAIFEQSACVSAHPSDLAPALLALDASVSIQSQADERSVPLGDFLSPPTDERRREAAIAHDEVITAVTIPAQPAGARGVYLKMMDRHAWAYALVSAAAQIAITDGVVTHARVVLGAVANVPRRLEQVEAMLVGARPTLELTQSAAALAVEGATPLAHNRYKIQLARELTRRAMSLASGLEWS